MSQFRKTGTYWVSEWNGDDLNAGTDPLLPKASLGVTSTSIPTQKIIVGSGSYFGAVTGSKYFEADGLVIVDWNNTAIPSASRHFGMWYRNFISLGFNTVVDPLIENCIFDSATNPLIVIRTANGLVPANIRNIFLKNFRQNGNSNWQSYNSIFIGKMNTVTSIGYAYFRNNFADKQSEIVLNVTLAPTEIVNNLINCLIRIVGSLTFYESKFLIDGSARPDADGAVLDIALVFPNFYVQGNFSSIPDDVKFIDVVSRTVEPTSILLQKSNAFGFIGGVKVGKKIGLAEAGFTITKTGINDTNPDSWRIADGVTFATVRITGKVSDSLISAQTLDIRIPFFFDGSEIGGSANNNNVPDSVNGLTNSVDTLGDKPMRLRYQVRSSILTNPTRNNNDDWDNDTAGVPGRYYLMEYGTPMLHHILSAVAYGNADKFAINAPVKQPFNYRSLDIIITISNTREI